MDISVRREHRSRKSKRLELNNSTCDLNMHEHVRIERVTTLVVDGERFTKHELKAILRAARKCGCGECFDCEVALEAKRSGL